MKKKASSKVNVRKTYEKDYKKIMKSYTTGTKTGTGKVVTKWPASEPFEIFTMFKEVQFGTTSTESCITQEC
jgi:hypothetical protein